MRHLLPSKTCIVSRSGLALTAGLFLGSAATTTTGADDPPTPASAAPQTLESTSTSTQPIDLPDTTHTHGSPAKVVLPPSNPPAPSIPTPSPCAPAPSEPSLTIATDRPGFGDTTTIAPVGHLQLELGYTYTYRDRRGVESHTHNAPELLARIGLIADRLEVRVSTSGYVWSRSNDGSGNGFEDVSGLSDVAIGARLKICDQDGLIPRLAFGVSTTISMGDDEISNQEFEPTVRFIGSWNLGSNFSLTSNVGLTYASPADGRFVQGFGSVSLGYAATDRLSLFFEYFVVGPRSKGTHAAHAIDFGGAYLINKRVQIDARLGVGLNQEADNLFAGTGLSILF